MLTGSPLFPQASVAFGKLSIAFTKLAEVDMDLLHVAGTPHLPVRCKCAAEPLFSSIGCGGTVAAPAHFLILMPTLSRLMRWK